MELISHKMKHLISQSWNASIVVDYSIVSVLQFCIHFLATLQWLAKSTALGRAFLANVHLKNEGLICHQVTQNMVKCGPKVIVWVPAVVWKRLTDIREWMHTNVLPLWARHTSTRPWWHRFPLGTLEEEAGSSLYQSLQQPAQLNNVLA